MNFLCWESMRVLLVLDSNDGHSFRLILPSDEFDFDCDGEVGHAVQSGEEQFEVRVGIHVPWWQGNF